ncbi:PREDICTED: translation initiation factor IF-2-like, partial [Chinchilla lanigera]|uniref:translation initiation factor IF-2-like n=1 Tax=Chinchilla lanigera TaxID=34839 RepID=UPI0006968577
MPQPWRGGLSARLGRGRTSQYFPDTSPATHVTAAKGGKSGAGPAALAEPPAGGWRARRGGARSVRPGPSQGARRSSRSDRSGPLGELNPAPASEARPGGWPSAGPGSGAQKEGGAALGARVGARPGRPSHTAGAGAPRGGRSGRRGNPRAQGHLLKWRPAQVRIADWEPQAARTQVASAASAPRPETRGSRPPPARGGRPGPPPRRG